MNKEVRYIDYLLGGKLLNEENSDDEDTYKIIRYYRDSSHPDHQKVIKTGLTREEAKEHCRDSESEEEGVWFDGFIKE